MRRILSIVLKSLVATAVVSGASVAALAGDSAVRVQGAWISEGLDFVSDPDRCGPGGFFLWGPVRGRDTLGGLFEASTTFCIVEEASGVWREFDYEANGTYLVTGEEFTLRSESFIGVTAPLPVCVEVPEKPIKFTMDGFTGEHAGGRLKGHSDYITRGAADLCGGLGLRLPRAITWWYGVFTPNAPGQ